METIHRSMIEVSETRTCDVSFHYEIDHCSLTGTTIEPVVDQIHEEKPLTDYEYSWLMEELKHLGYEYTKDPIWGV